MSLDLSVPFEKEFIAGDLLYQSGQALMEILAVKHIPDFVAEVEEKDGVVPIESEFLCGTDSPMLLIGFRGLEDRVRMMFYEIESKSEFVPESEVGLRARILSGEGLGQWGGPLRFALAASVAVGMAQLGNSTIRDYKLTLGFKKIQRPEELVRFVRLHSSFKDIQEATHKLFSKAPLAAINRVGLRSLVLEEEVDKVMVDLLGLVKISKRLDEKLLHKFNGLVDELLEVCGEDAERRNNVMGLLFLVYEYLHEESRHSQAPLPFQQQMKWIRNRIGYLGLDLPGAGDP